MGSPSCSRLTAVEQLRVRMLLIETVIVYKLGYERFHLCVSLRQRKTFMTLQLQSTLD